MKAYMSEEDISPEARAIVEEMMAENKAAREGDRALQAYARSLRQNLVAETALLYTVTTGGDPSELPECMRPMLPGITQPKSEE